MQAKVTEVVSVGFLSLHNVYKGSKSICGAKIVCGFSTKMLL